MTSKSVCDGVLFYEDKSLLNQRLNTDDFREGTISKKKYLNKYH